MGYVMCVGEVNLLPDCIESVKFSSFEAFISMSVYIPGSLSSDDLRILVVLFTSIWGRL